MKNERSIDEIITDIKKRDKKQNTIFVFIFIVIVISSIGTLSSLVFYLNNKIIYQENKLEKINAEYVELAKTIKNESEELSNINLSKIDNIDNALSKLDQNTKKQINLLWKSAYKKNKEVIDSIAAKIKHDNETHLIKINTLIESGNKHNIEIETVIKTLRVELNALSESLKKHEELIKINTSTYTSLKTDFLTFANSQSTVKQDIKDIKAKIVIINTSINELKSREDKISNKLIQPTKKTGG